MRPVRWPILVGSLSCLIGCLGDPVGPGAMLIVRRLSPVDSLVVGAPGRAVPVPISFQAVDGDGGPVPGAVVHWTITGTNGRFEQASSATDANGQLGAVWVLGTRASDAQALAVRVETGKHAGAAAIGAIAKPVEVSSIVVRDDTTTVKLGVPTALVVQATDPFGNQFVPTAIRFA